MMVKNGKQIGFLFASWIAKRGCVVFAFRDWRSADMVIPGLTRWLPRLKAREGLVKIPKAKCTSFRLIFLGVLWWYVRPLAPLV